jgi:NifU-like protein involved in Fe-S cluster formation
MPNINKKNASSSEKTEISTKSTEKKLGFLKKTCYSNKVIQLHVNRVNSGKIENADVALASTGSYGDTMKFYLKIKENNPIDDASFRYIGCPASTACGSILTQIARTHKHERHKQQISKTESVSTEKFV